MKTATRPEATEEPLSPLMPHISLLDTMTKFVDLYHQELEVKFDSSYQDGFRLCAPEVPDT
jgi:hypothetical protein